MNEPSSIARHRDAWALSAVPAGFFTYVELLKAHRSTVWVGGTPAGWAGAGLGFLLYWLIMGVLSEGFLFKLSRTHARARTSPPVGLAVAAAGLFTWGIAGLLAGNLRSATVAGVPLAAALLLGAVRWRSWRGPGGLLGSCLNALVAFFGGIAALVATNEIAFLSSKRAALVTLASAAIVAGAWILLETLRKRRGWARAGLALCFAGAVAAAVAWPVSPAARSETAAPNLLLITCDALRADCASVYGGPVPTPAFEALAARGTLYEHAYSFAPWTLPSMVGLFSSRYPPGIPADSPPDQWLAELGHCRVPAEAVTLAEDLRKAGYATAGFTANPLLTRTNGMLRGFQCARVFGHRIPVRKGWSSQLPALQGALAHLWPGQFPERPVDTSRILTGYARRFIERNRAEPFFLWVHFMDPHAAFDPPDRYRTLEGPHPVFCDADERWGWAGYPRDPETHSIILSEEDQRYVESLYRGEVRYVDECIGRLLEALRGLQLDERTVVCLTADHGEEFWEHGCFGHGQSLYDELVRVPLILAGPGIPAGRIESPVSALDLMPTLASMLGREVDPTWVGKVLPMQEEEGVAGEACLFRATNPLLVREPFEGIRLGPWKLVVGLRSGKSMLYHLSDDPSEEKDLSEAMPDRAAALRERLGEMDDQTITPSESIEPGMDETLQNLRTVGYL